MQDPTARHPGQQEIVQSGRLQWRRVRARFPRGGKAGPTRLAKLQRPPMRCGQGAVAEDAGALWLPLGIVSPEAIAEFAPVGYGEDVCTAIVHRAMP